MNQTLTFNLSNNTTAVIPISILGNNANFNDNTNSNTRFRWDFSSYVPSTETLLRIEYRSINEVSFKTAIIPLQDSSVNSILNAINSLNIGIFYLDVAGSNTYIQNFNSNYVFGQLDVYNPSSLVVTWSFNNTGGNIVITQNGNTIVSLSNLGSGSFPVNFGDAINISGNYQTTAFPPTDLATWYFTTNDPAYGGGSSNTIPPSTIDPYSVSFTINGVYSYDFSLNYGV
jgi:hypothetical protein